MANASEHRRKALKTVKTVAAILAVETAVAIPFITWAALKVQEPHPDIVWLPRLTATLNAMGFQHIPMQVVVLLAFAAVAFWLYVQLEMIITKARAGRIREEIGKPGLHFAIIAMWSWTGGMLLQHYEISVILTVAANASGMAALIGILWRVSVWETRDNDPTSSLFGRARHALPDPLAMRRKGARREPGQH